MSLVSEFIATVVREPDTELPSKRDFRTFLDECYSYRPDVIEFNNLYFELRQEWNKKT